MLQKINAKYNSIWSQKWYDTLCIEHKTVAAYSVAAKMAHVFLEQ